MIAAGMHDRATLALLVGARIPEEWPGGDLAEALPFMLTAALRDPAHEGFQVWLAVFDDEVVCDIGGHGKPDDAGIVEIGFSVMPAWRGRGFASESAAAIAEWMLARPEVLGLIARTSPENLAAQRVLEKIGMRCVMHEPDLLRYEMTR